MTDLVDSNATLRLHRAFDSFGNIVDETHYDADGIAVTQGQTGYLDEVFAYTGRLLDTATGLQNNLNRWYDASVGRWLSEDPIGFAAGDANMYRYVGNGAVNGTDPSGLFGPGVIGYPPGPPINNNPWAPVVPSLPTVHPKCLLYGGISAVGGSIGGPPWMASGGLTSLCCCEIEYALSEDDEPQPPGPEPKPKPEPGPPFNPKPYPVPITPNPPVISGTDPPTFDPTDPIWIGY